MHTTTQYRTLDEAFAHFNARMFDGRLPSCLITLQRRGNSRGYFIGDGFRARHGNQVTDEIALNPDTFATRTDSEILSTLVHEMVHLWQHHLGQPPRRAYHDRQWADRMESIGLMPSDTGAPGGKRTGARCTHYIIAGGPFDQAVAAFLSGGKVALTWASVGGDSAAKAKSAASKTKFTCPVCRQNAWAKPGAVLMCGDLEMHDKPELMVAEPAPAGP